jgi:hypothetical protein
MKKLLALTICLFAINTQSANITVSDPTCGSYTYTMQGADITLTCGAVSSTTSTTLTTATTTTTTQAASCDDSKSEGGAIATYGYLSSGQAKAYSLGAVPASTTTAAQIQGQSAIVTVTISPNKCDFASTISYKCKLTDSSGIVINLSTYDARLCPATPGVEYFMNVHMGSPDGSGGWIGDAPGSFLVF